MIKEMNACLCINDLSYCAAGNSRCNLIIIMAGPLTEHAVIESEISEVVHEVLDDDSVVRVKIVTLMMTTPN